MSKDGRDAPCGKLRRDTAAGGRFFMAAPRRIPAYSLFVASEGAPSAAFFFPRASKAPRDSGVQQEGQSSTGAAFFSLIGSLGEAFSSWTQPARPIPHNNTNPTAAIRHKRLMVRSPFQGGVDSSGEPANENVAALLPYRGCAAVPNEIPRNAHSIWILRIGPTRRCSRRRH